MLNFLNSTCAVCIWIIAVLELCLLGFMVYRFVKTKSKLSLLTACITFGLFYDAFIIALGVAVPAGNMAFLSRMRFVFHGLLIPILLSIIALALDLKKPFNIILFVLTGVLMVAGVAQAVCNKLEVVEIANISRMASMKEGNPGWIKGITNLLNFGTIFPLIGAGIYAWIKQKNPFLFIAGFCMFLFSVLGIPTKGFMFYISMYGEILMVTFLTVYAIKKEGRCI